jgi:hypothetical protein
MSNFKHRVLEIHSVYAWDLGMVRRAMDFARENGMTAIALHRNDFVDKLVYPAKYVGGRRPEGYFTASEMYNDVYVNMYKNDPLYRDMPCRSGVYFRRLLCEAEKRNLAVFIENKEISFPDYIELLHPELRKNGALCPCESFLFEYLEEKYFELFRLYPNIAGIITSLATSESKASFAVNHCTCDICKNTTEAWWYDKVVSAMYKPIKTAGARLILRDFVFDASAHAGISTALDRLPEDIAFSLKNTPHDYYPTFPNNARIGKTPGRNQWIEYDVFGQYYGLGVGVAIMNDDIRHRLDYAAKNNVEGILVRTCWEGLYGVSVFDTPNMINLFSAAALSKDTSVSDDCIYDRWLRYRNFYALNAVEDEKQQALAAIIGVLAPAWDVLRRAAYMNECVFNDSTYYPSGMEHAFWLGEVKNSLQDWDASKKTAMSADTVENIRLILLEKDRALELARELNENAKNLGTGLSKEAVVYLSDFMEAYLLYVRGYQFLGKGAILTRYFVTDGPSRAPEFCAEASRELTICLDGLDRMQAEFETLWRETDNYYFQAYFVLDPEKMMSVAKDFKMRLKGTAYAQEEKS